MASNAKADLLEQADFHLKNIDNLLLKINMKMWSYAFIYI